MRLGAAAEEDADRRITDEMMRDRIDQRSPGGFDWRALLRLIRKPQVPVTVRRQLAVPPHHVRAGVQAPNVSQQRVRFRNSAGQEVPEKTLGGDVPRHRAGSQQRFHFRGERQLPVRGVVIQRLDAEAIARGAVNTAREIGAKFLVAMTESGSSATNVSLARPPMPIIAFSPNPQTRRRMALLWGVVPRELPQLSDTDTVVDWVTADLMASGLASPGERIVVVFGAPLGVSGSTNSIRVHVVG